MSIDLLLSRLDGVKQVGECKWRARCPSCGGRNKTKLSIGYLGDGRVLIHDFGGCSPDQVVEAIGMSLADLMPPRPRDTCNGPGGHSSVPVLKSNPYDVIRAAAHEAIIIAISIESDWRGENLSLEDWDRVMVAVRRLRAFADACTS